MSSGGPQGSILGPLLFICYINDLPSSLSDDTALLVKGLTVELINRDLNSELHLVEDWSNANKLSVNALKTKAMLFSHSRFKDKETPLVIKSKKDSTPAIELVDTYKYLGVHLNSHLSFEHHLDKFCKKINSRTYLLSKLQNFVSNNLAKDLYSTLIEPHFLYADVVYDGASQKSK